MNPSYYKEYYNLEREHWWFAVRGKIIINHLKIVVPGRTNKILNIGAATGRTSELLSELGTVTSLEYDKDCCDFVTKELHLSIINGSILNLPFDNDSFDLVCAFDVIEHVENDTLAVSEMIRVCREGGLISITVPAFMQLWSHHDVVNQHYRRYSAAQLEKLFKDESGEVLYKSYFNSILFIPILSFRLASHIISRKWLRRGAGSDFTVFKKESFVNKVLLFLFGLEKPLLKVIRFPFGVSILFTFRKK